MKTLTCRQMDGMCDEPISAETSQQMIDVCMEHVKMAHPDMAKNIEATPKDDPKMVAWYEKFMKTWAETPEDK